MSFSYPLTMPAAPLPMALTPKPRAVVGGTPSPFTLHRQTQVRQGQQWAFAVSYPPVPQSAAGAWEAFLLKLNGRQGTFLFGDDSRLVALGSAASSPGTPVVKGASQSGNALACDGAPNGVTGYLLEGDPISLGTGTNTRLYKVLTDTDTDGSGNFTVDIWPSLQVTPGDNDAVTVAAAKGLFRLAANVMTWDIATQLHYGFTLDIESVV